MTLLPSRTGSDETVKGSQAKNSSSDLHPSGIRGMMREFMSSPSMPSSSCGRPLTLVFTGVMTSFVRTSGRSWNSPVKKSQYTCSADAPASRSARYAQSATRREWPRTVVLGILGVLAHLCWNLSWPMMFTKCQSFESGDIISLPPARSRCWRTCRSISSLVSSMP